jgi:hypothetical protein
VGAAARTWPSVPVQRQGRPVAARPPAYFECVDAIFYTATFYDAIFCDAFFYEAIFYAVIFESL